MTGGGAGTGKGGIGQAATEALGRLTRHDHRADGGRATGRRVLVTLAAVILILAGWGLWEVFA